MSEGNDRPRNERLTDQAHLLVRERVGAGDVVVDATVGNGHDTVFLAGLVGETGKVIGFDLQEAAIANTRRRIPEERAERVELHRCGHERMRELVPGPVQAVMFNLGYLPGSDKSVITRAETTVAALRQAVELLAPGGIVILVVYTGHDGARAEADAVTQWIEDPDADDLRVLENGRLEAGERSPYLVALERSRIA